MESSLLLDTPKRMSLSARSAHLRLELKEWEKRFSTLHDGRKPSTDDIKADNEVSKKYKDYQKLRDVLSGKSNATVLDDHPATITKQPANQGPRKTKPSAPQVTRTEKAPSHFVRLQHHAVLEYPLLDAIGPTPQRDGKVLGLFDSLGSRTPVETPSGKKRKFDALEPPNKMQVANETTPTLRRTGTLGQSPNSRTVDDPDDSHASGGKHSRTPTSNSKRTIMNQFLRTPVTSRYASMVIPSGSQKPLMVSHTPLRDSLLRMTPKPNEAAHQSHVDFTPPYLKRSFSFKDRLLSATTTVHSGDPPRPSTSHSSQSRPVRPLRRTASMPKPLSEIVQNLRQLEEGQHEDDLDALRELETGESGVQIRSSQQDEAGIEPNTDQENLRPGVPMGEPPTKIWRKKGQKRTTRKSTMRPATVQRAEAPKYVALDEEDIPTEGVAVDEGWSAENTSKEVGHIQALPRKSDTQLSNGKKPRSQKAQTVNPNAQAHMNFRSLKLRNKNSKAKGGGRFGGGRFGRQRR